jgi:hypothetical protein
VVLEESGQIVDNDSPLLRHISWKIWLFHDINLHIEKNYHYGKNGKTCMSTVFSEQ